METQRFDHLVRSLTASGSRRGLLARVAFAPLGAGLLALPAAEAAAKKRKRKATICQNGQTVKVSKKKLKKRLRQGATRGACGCVPRSTCPADLNCGVIDDSCGGTITCGTCGGANPYCVENVCRACTADNPCAAGSLCVANTCEPCDVCANGCDYDGVQAAIDGTNKSTLYICPGTYSGDKAIATIARNLTLIGAGDGASGASNTILDATGASTLLKTVVQIAASTKVTLRGLRLTGGREGIAGGVINHGEADLADCTLIGNSGLYGGAIDNDGTLTLTRCAVSTNTSGSGAGIYNEPGCTATLTDCDITENTSSGLGGGIHNNGGTVNLTRSRIADNTAGTGGGIYNGDAFETDGFVIFEGGNTVTGNTATDGGGGGGGIYNSGTVTFNKATDITGNHANSGNGSGISNTDSGTLNNRNLANVSNNTPPANQCSGCP